MKILPRLSPLLNATSVRQQFARQVSHPVENFREDMGGNKNVEINKRTKMAVWINNASICAGLPRNVTYSRLARNQNP
jgi:hypothetical protein